MTISDLERVLDYTQTKTSRHVTYLKNSGLLNTRKQDQWIFYSIKEEVYDIVQQMLQFLLKDPQLQNDIDIYHIMHSNRELAINKIEAKDYRP
jgi:ArsR family transcriptional regulator